MAHRITGNKFDPNKDIPDLGGKVSRRPKRPPMHNARKTALTASKKVYVVTGGTAGFGFGITAHLQDPPAVAKR